jgi:hypothetical protein
LKEAEAYSLLKPVYQINILNFNLFPTNRYMSKFSLRDDFDPNITLILEITGLSESQLQEKGII